MRAASPRTGPARGARRRGGRAVPLALAITLALVAAASAPAHAAPGRLGAQFRYWSFDDGNDNRNPLIYWVPGPIHVQFEVWDFERGRDQFRPEVGFHLRDARRSSYRAEWRHENRLERFTLGTDQVLSDHLVGKVSAAALVAIDHTDYTATAGFDWYWQSWNFASIDVIRDPRGDDLWVVPMRLRLATEANDWVQVTVAPASRRTLGWAGDLKMRWLRLGVEQNSRYDFTTRDNVIFTVGFELALPEKAE